MITLESLLNNESSNINEEISLEDYSFELSNYTMECSDIMCEINTLEAASIVCEDGENKKNIFKQMVAKIKAAIKWIKDTWVNKIWPKIKAFFQKIFKGKKVDEKAIKQDLEELVNGEDSERIKNLLGNIYSKEVLEK